MIQCFAPRLILQSGADSPVKTHGAKRNWSKLILAIAVGHFEPSWILSNALNHTVTAGAKMPPPHATIRLGAESETVIFIQLSSSNAPSPCKVVVASFLLHTLLSDDYNS